MAKREFSSFVNECERQSYTLMAGKLDELDEVLLFFYIFIFIF